MLQKRCSKQAIARSAVHKGDRLLIPIMSFII